MGALSFIEIPPCGLELWWEAVAVSSASNGGPVGSNSTVTPLTSPWTQRRLPRLVGRCALATQRSGRLGIPERQREPVRLERLVVLPAACDERRAPGRKRRERRP